ncbi:MAG: ATP-dependent DNA helicase RecG [Candidatus Saccharimonadales bacterium]
MVRLTTSLHEIKGVGDKTWQQLQAAGLMTVGDLIEFLPRAYEDYTQITKIADLHPGNVVIRGKITNIASRFVRRGLHVTTAVLSDDSGKVPITWFNQPYRAKHIAGGGEWLLSGEFAFSQRRYQIMNPSVRSSDEIIESGGQSILPIYRQVAGIKTAILHKLIEEIRPVITMTPELLPEKIVTHAGVMSYADALLALHFPESSHDVEAGKKRIAFQEVIELLYGAELNRQENDSLSSYAIPFDLDSVKKFVVELPFRLTDDQRRAAWDIIQSFETGKPMNRLLQGDVGSGKTVVAGISALVAARAGYQTAIMAPTELLARQHAETLSRLLEPFGVMVGLLIGSLKKKPKDELKQQIASGAVAVTVGTHALIQESVRFHQLGFVVIDEQHRFGVTQRQKLLGKGHIMPHLLAMTATPIPRSLQLTMYGDLDISILREKPAGRKEIITKVISPNSRATLFASIDKEIESGRQVYVVCPLIDSTQSAPLAHSYDRKQKIEKNDFSHAVSELPVKEHASVAAGDDQNIELSSVTAEYERLKKTAFKHRRIGLLHGKMHADEKQHIMKQFAEREIDILVSTTVIEVGVDVPNATVMVIEGAERFGLAQLHQLRGRVGRSDHQSYCYLITTESKQTTSLRLRELEQSNDGFYLAEKDLEMRGPGEIYGRAQHGELNLQVANLADMQSIRKVKSAIAWARANDVDLLQYEGMKQRVDRYRRITTLN